MGNPLERKPMVKEPIPPTNGVLIVMAIVLALLNALYWPPAPPQHCQPVEITGTYA